MDASRLSKDLKILEGSGVGFWLILLMYSGIEIAIRALVEQYSTSANLERGSLLNILYYFGMENLHSPALSSSITSMPPVCALRDTNETSIWETALLGAPLHDIARSLTSKTAS